MPTKGTPRHAIRIPDALWSAAITKAGTQDRKLSDLIRGWLQDYVNDDKQGEK